MSEALEQLKSELKKIAYYDRACTLFSWDMYTQVPRAGYEDMGDALTYFSTEAFTLKTSDKLFEILETLSAPEEFEALDELWKFSVKVLKREMDENRRVPKDFYSAFVAAQTASSIAWEEAKEADDFSHFAPHLDRKDNSLSGTDTFRLVNRSGWFIFGVG